VRFLYALDFGIFIFLLGLGIKSQGRGESSISFRAIFIFCVTSALVSLSLGLSYAAAVARYSWLALFFARLVGAGNIWGSLTFAVLAAVFPRERMRHPLWGVALFIWVILAIIILTGDQYLVSVTWEAGAFYRQSGPLFYPIAEGNLALGLLSVSILFIRRFSFRSPIHKLQAVVLMVGTLIGFLATFFISVILPYFHVSWTYPLVGIAIAFLATTLYYGASITRLFDPKVVAASILSFLVFSLIMGALAGGSYALLASQFMRKSPALAFILGLCSYALAFMVDRLAHRRFARFRNLRRNYADKLEAGLSLIDFSQGRDYVVTRTLGLLSDALGSSSVRLFVQGTNELLMPVGLEADAESAPPIDSLHLEILSGTNDDVLFKTEVIANFEYAWIRPSLLSIFESLDAEALVLLREGRNLIGLISLGGRRSGSGLTAYDFDALVRCSGKLFVICYYLKHIAQESLVLTVDRELEYSSQIIQSIQENIDRVVHPAIDVSYITRCARKLGGDFIDFIQLSKDRYLFVMGDVSGKGLNASMSMVILKSVIRTFLKESHDFKTLVIETNDFIKKRLPRGTFFAGVVGLFDFSKGSLHYVNCGIPAMVLFSSSYNNPVEIQGEGKVLGFVPDYAPHVAIRKTSFAPGDCLLVTTDGLLEASSARGLRFGVRRMQDQVSTHLSLSASRIVKFLVDEVDQFVSQDLNDDITILAIKFLPQENQ